MKQTQLNKTIAAAAAAATPVNKGTEWAQGQAD